MTLDRVNISNSYAVVDIVLPDFFNIHKAVARWKDLENGFAVSVHH